MILLCMWNTKLQFVSEQLQFHDLLVISTSLLQEFGILLTMQTCSEMMFFEFESIAIKWQNCYSQLTSECFAGKLTFLKLLMIQMIDYRPYEGGVASRLATIIYVGNFDNYDNYSPNDSNLKYTFYGKKLSNFGIKNRLTMPHTMELKT